MNTYHQQDTDTDDEDLAIADALLGKQSNINIGRNIQPPHHLQHADQLQHHNTQSLLDRLAPPPPPPPPSHHKIKPASQIKPPSYDNNNKPLSSRISNHLRHHSYSPTQSTSSYNQPPRRFSTPSNSNSKSIPLTYHQQHHHHPLRDPPEQDHRKVSILIENLPPYSALTPRRLYEHLANLAHAINHQHHHQNNNNNNNTTALPYALKLYRYTRSDCVCAELKFNGLANARHFVNHANPIWPHVWYTYSKISHIPYRKKFMEFSLLDHDKPISWPSYCESYYPKYKPNSYHPVTRPVPREEPLPETSPRPAHTAEVTCRKSAVPKPTPSQLPVKHQADCYRPKVRGAYQDNLPPKKKPRTPSLQPPSPKKDEEEEEEKKSHEIIKNQISLLLSQSSTASTSNPPPQNSTNLSKKTTSDATQLPSSDAKVAHDKQPTTALSITTPSSNLSVITGAGSSKIPGLGGDGSPALTVHSGSSKSPAECADSRFPNPSFTMERMQKQRDKESTMMTMKGVLLCKMLPSINLSVLQSHFLIPNRPRDFRIFEPRQISYGPFLSTNTTQDHHHRKNALDQLEIGCLISFNDASTAAHFSRVLHLNSPFHPLQVQLVDPAHIQFHPSATTINNPPKPHQQEQQEQQEQEQQQTSHHLVAAGSSYTPVSGYFPTTTTTTMYLDGLPSEYTPWTRQHSHDTTGSLAFQLQSPPPVPPHGDIPAYNPYYLADFSLLTRHHSHGHLDGLGSTPSSPFPPFLLASEPPLSSSSDSQLFFPPSLHPTPEPLRAHPLCSATNDPSSALCDASFPAVQASASSEPPHAPRALLLPAPHPSHDNLGHDGGGNPVTDPKLLHQLRLKKILQARKTPSAAPAAPAAAAK